MQRNRPIRATDRTLLTNTKEQLQRWQEHFSKILNSSVDNQIAEEEGEKEEYVRNPRINIKAPKVTEIKKGMKELKRGKAAGVDNIPPEVLKVDLDITANMLHSLFEKIWNEGEMPNDWKCGPLIKYQRRGTPQTVAVGGVLHFCLYQAKSLIGYCLIGSRNMSTIDSERNKRVSAQTALVLIKSIHYR